MYPSERDRYYGIFVRNIENSLAERGASFPAKALIRGRSQSTAGKLLAYLKFYFEICWLGLTCRYDYVYVHFITHAVLPLTFLRLFKRRKLIIHIHGGEIFPVGTWTRLLHRLSCNIVRQADVIIVPSPFFREETIKSYGLSGSNIIISPSGGVDRKFFTPQSAPISGRFRIGYVGRIDPGKGWNVLLDGIEVLKQRYPELDPEVVFVGDGAETEAFKAAVAGSAVSALINYKGPLSHDELPAFYAGLHLFIFPSLLPESLGLVGLEAMASGVPVIGSDYGGIRGYLKDGENGFTFERGNSSMLAEKIYQYYNLSASEKLSLHANAINTARSFSSDHVGNVLIEDLKKALQNG